MADKTYFHIVGMTEKFRKTFKPSEAMDASGVHWYWLLTILLAGAQQLSVIAGELKEMREAIQKGNGNA